MPSDLIIVGAGAAGLAAARTARAAGLRTLLLEAKDRIGGRGYTETRRFAAPVDYGCHWLHAGDINPFTRHAEDLGFVYHETRPSPWLFSPNTGGKPAPSAEFRAYGERCWQAAYAAGERGEDVAIAEVVERDSRWYPVFSAWCAALNGREPEYCSTLDWYRFRDTGADWPVIDGYGALIAAYGRGLPVELGTRVEEVVWGGRRGVTLRTSRGELQTRAALVTVSTGVLAAGLIRFTPPLPEAKQGAIASLPLGLANKIVIEFSADVLGVPDTSYLRIDDQNRDSIGFQLRPYGREQALGYVAGAFAAEIERGGRAAAVDLALEQLAAAYGNDLRRAVVRSDLTAWGEDPHCRGSYSVALPGAAGQRQVLAEPLAEQLYFAGEAVSAEAYGTAHGAYHSGVAAVESIVRKLFQAPRRRG